MKKKITNIILILIFLTGLSLLLYPTASNYWNSLHATRAIASYAEETASLDADKYDELWAAAVEYNAKMAFGDRQYVLTEERAAEYNSLLNVGGTGVMGYIEIESIDVSLPIYHGTSDSVLQIAVGHLDWTSLPAGGESTHTVLSGHRGLPSARLFTNLDKLAVGDTFILRILDEILTYEVDQILIVEPTDTTALQIEEGKDLCTLVTCTPYGINSHRLLVRGHRIDNAVSARLVHVTSDAIEIEPLIVAAVIAIPLLFILILFLFMTDSKPNGGHTYHDFE